MERIVIDAAGRFWLQGEDGNLRPLPGPSASFRRRFQRAPDPRIVTKPAAAPAAPVQPTLRAAFDALRAPCSAFHLIPSGARAATKPAAAAVCRSAAPARPGVARAGEPSAWHELRELTAPMRAGADRVQPPKPKQAPTPRRRPCVLRRPPARQRAPRVLHVMVAAGRDAQGCHDDGGGGGGDGDGGGDPPSPPRSAAPRVHERWGRP